MGYPQRFGVRLLLLDSGQSHFSPLLSFSPDFIQDSLSDPAEGRTVVSVTKVENAGHLVGHLFRGLKNSFVNLCPNQGCTRTAYSSCGGDRGHPRWNQPSPATEALIMALVIHPDSYICVSCCISTLREIYFEDLQMRFFGCSSVRALTEYQRKLLAGSLRDDFRRDPGFAANQTPNAT